MIIDLSVELNENTPAYPGDPKIGLRQSAAYTSEGYLGHSIELGTHTGTHIDAPAHMIEGGPTLGGLSLETFTGVGKLVKGFSKEAIDAAGISAGDSVLFDTGTSERYYDPSYFTDYPVMTEGIADYLVEKGAKMVGVDTCSVDDAEGFPVHKKLLAAGIPIIENLTNLAALQGKTFQLVAMPLKVNLDGAPIRAFAVTQDA
jgi:kynurenine formamidase